MESGRRLDPPRKKNAIKLAVKRIENFHLKTQAQGGISESSQGVRCWKEFRAIDPVGLYVPGGSSPLISSIWMQAIPAKIAGCKTKIVCTPPRKDGSIDPLMIYAAKLCGIEKIFKVGGAQAIAAMAWGTETIPKVKKIFGPGNLWVTTAKKLLSQTPKGPSCDMPAGPSEVMVIGDEKAKASFIASDLLAQAEHGCDSQVIFITDYLPLIQSVKDQILKQLQQLNRQEILKKSLQFCRFIHVQSIDKAIAIANEYAPEHLILQLEQASQYIPLIENAGSVFLGSWSPESVGDYASGPNHVLPTNGFAANRGGLCVEDFRKAITFQELNDQGLSYLGPTVETLAMLEGLDGHKNAVSIRLDHLANRDKPL